MLVQRNSLDFINQALPLYQGAVISKRLSPDDQLQLITATLITLSKRDVSLSRRVFSWIFRTSPMPEEGPTTNLSEFSQVEYHCHDDVKDLLTKAILNLLDMNLDSTVSTLTFPQLFRIVLTFVEKRPVGEMIIDRVIVGCIHFMYCRAQSDPNTGYKHCDILFSNFGSDYIWDSLIGGFAFLCNKSSGNHFQHSAHRIKDVDEWCNLVTFLLGGLSAVSFSLYFQKFI